MLQTFYERQSNVIFKPKWFIKQTLGYQKDSRFSKFRRQNFPTKIFKARFFLLFNLQKNLRSQSLKFSSAIQGHFFEIELYFNDNAVQLIVALVHR